MLQTVCLASRRKISVYYEQGERDRRKKKGYLPHENSSFKVLVLDGQYCDLPIYRKESLVTISFSVS